MALSVGSRSGYGFIDLYFIDFKYITKSNTHIRNTTDPFTNRIRNGRPH